MATKAVLEAVIRVSSRDTIHGRKIAKELGLVAGNCVKARGFVFDITSRFKGVVGGELQSYTELMVSTSAEATARMMEEAKKLGADSVVQVRYQQNATSDPTAGTNYYAMCYGTAVQTVAEEEEELDVVASTLQPSVRNHRAIEAAAYKPKVHRVKENAYE